ncbi:unnamed protein product [Thelazia callipaeda]|uniref:Exonuclease 1 n=1 Tax=Thelazia callipaeda TaxID=103827 RepID=A0A0N5CKD1_THECL|nr:unnamed protein product [Thelazia callipaeda]
MGIPNLLPFVKNACRQGNISELANQSVAVDVSCLLHRGLIGCADKVAQGHETDFYIHYVMKYVKALLANNCHVILVFDGQMLPAKKETNSSRREKRDFQKQRGDLLMSQGRSIEAYDCFKRSASLTTKIIESAIQAFRQLEMVDVIVAPYESDAQLTFLMKSKMVEAVVTEDSDLIAFGCEKIVFKMESTGSCVIFEQHLLPKCLCRALADQFDFDKFRRICILSGCDYLQAGLHGVGLNKAATFFAKTTSKNLHQILPRLPRYLNKNSLKITKQFIADFIRAENTFLHQIIFDPIERRQRPLNDYPIIQKSSENDCSFDLDGQESTDDFAYAGSIQPPEIALSFALGNIPGGSQGDPIVLPQNVPDWSIWSPNYRTASIRPEKKSDKEIKKKSLCGAFTITLSESFEAKTPEHKIESRPSPFRILNNQPAVDLDLYSMTVQNSKRNNIFANFERRQTCFPVIGTTKRGNGALQNWNCDRLLKEFSNTGTKPLFFLELCRSNNTNHYFVLSFLTVVQKINGN